MKTDFMPFPRYAETDSGHPFVQRDKEDVENQGISIRGTLFANLTPIKGLTITSRFGYRIYQSYYTRYAPPYYASSMAYKTNYDIKGKSEPRILLPVGKFRQLFFQCQKNTFTLMGGMSYIQNNSFGVDGTGSGPDPLQGYAPNFRYLSYLNNNPETSKM